ncbi:MAG TPA: protein kinase [Planctomycetota bacterium]|nr:protein kinase [Planctomycetota bacterium]
MKELGPYELLETLGTGATGTVYRARHKLLGREVALKVVRFPSGEEKDARARFAREARAAARLDHPNVARLLEVSGEGEPEPYLAMELVRGESLRSRLARGPLDEETALALVSKVARGLHHAHERGIVHRDLKPENVLIDESGEPKVVDFGLARDARDELKLTQTGAILGTPIYLAPEQVRGEAKLDARTDVWALGVLLHELVTGRPPFPGPDLLELLTAIKERPVEPPPGKAAEIVRRALEKDPAGRFPSALAFAEACGGPAPSPLRKEGRGSGLLILLAAFFIVGGIAWGAYSLAHSAPHPDPPPAARGEGASAPTHPFVPRSFAHQLTKIDVKAVAASAYDLLILDETRDDTIEGALRKDELDAIRAARPGRRVLAHMSVSQAEVGRPYWHEDWEDDNGRLAASAPSWLRQAHRDEEGGGFQVPYWDPEWQRVLETSLDRKIDAGFDGVLLDGVDDFDRWKRGPEDMAELVKRLAKHAREERGRPAFLVYATNGNVLGGREDMVALLDGIEVEGVWFGEDALLPASEADETLATIEPFRKAHKPILVLAYLSKKDLVEDLARRCSEKGFVGYAAPRGLASLR